MIKNMVLSTIRTGNKDLGDNIMKIYGINGRKNIAGSRIKAIRERNGWSQADLAAKLQVENVVVEQKAISRIERGERLMNCLLFLRCSRFPWNGLFPVRCKVR